MRRYARLCRKLFHLTLTLSQRSRHAAWNGGSGQNGREYDAPPGPRRSPAGCFRLSADAVKQLVGDRCDGIDLARRSRHQAQSAARRMDHGSRWRSHRKNRPNSCQAHASGRHNHRRWQLDVQRRRPPRHETKDKGIHYVDVGTSGGVWGIDRGYCMMIGGPKEAVQQLDPIFKTLAPGSGDIPRTPGSREATAPPKRATSTAAIRRGPFREDGSQRHRVRHHAGLRRRFRHLQERHQQGTARGFSLQSQSSRISRKSGGAAASSVPGCWT